MPVSQEAGPKEGALFKRVFSWLGVGALVAGVLGLSGSPSIASAASRATSSGATVTFAESPGTPPTYIFPLEDSAHSGESDTTYLQPLMWPPLYWFGHPTNSAPTINYKLSMAGPPKVSNGGKTLTMHLKHYMWSTGEPVTARDVVFWMNLILNEKTNFAGYTPGGWMTHVASYSAPSPTTFVLNMNVAYNLTFLLYTGLGTITPIPQQAWDRTSGTSPVGTYDTTSSGAKSVYNYLNSRSLALATWDKTALWQVVDGPWHLQPKTGFQVTGQVTMLPNKSYSGPNKPKIGKFEELPFTSATAEYDALLSGAVDYGYIPTTDIGSIGSLKARGFSVKPWYSWGISLILINFANPKYGPLEKQLYIRQAMEMMIDQPVYVKTILKGYGVPTYGPVPATPRTKFVGKSEDSNPYPYNPKGAKKLLASHGWKIESGKADVCVKAGTTSGECGAGISAGTQLSIPLLYGNSVPATNSEIQILKSTFSKIGIELQLSPAPTGTVLGEVADCIGSAEATCKPTSPALSDWGSPSYFYVPEYFPLPTVAFECGGTSNFGDYCNHEVDKLFTVLSVQQNASKELTEIHSLEGLLTNQIPVLWFPGSAYQISAISSKVGGVKAQDSTTHIYPETWTVKS